MRKLIFLLLFMGFSSIHIADISPNKGIEVKGMTISCQTWGWEWGTDKMVESMKELKALGVNWISIHPYARVSLEGTVQSRRINANHNLTWLTRPIIEAHKLGLKICIKPHLAYWGSGFRWRGEISFHKSQQWDNFFKSYSALILNLAQICNNSDAIVIGTELDKTVAYEDEWRDIIKQIRSVYSGPISYAANWTDYKDIPFWDALDAIGIQAYFPLTQSPNIPDMNQLTKAWNQYLLDLNQFAAKWDKSIVFTELGYDVSLNAAYKPWEPGRYSKEALELQRKCLESALHALASKDRVIGAFLWKWFPGNVGRENFLESTPVMREVIKENWASSALQ